MFEFHMVSCEHMENKLVCEEDLKHFHTSLLGNEEDAQGLLNITQEVSSCKPENYLQTGDLKFASGDYISPVSRQ